MDIPLRQKIMAIIIAISIFIAILELIRRRKLREEYSWLWLMTGCLLIVMALCTNLLRMVTYLIGAVVPTSTLFFCAIIFIILLCLQFSVKISQLTNSTKNLMQEIAILKSFIEEMHKKENVNNELSEREI